ncbi:MAG: prepilin-type N-terminal cleavage/methylation domain-containing protein [Gemmatimonadetes bacterium]|nr:prepilin-type N-terminal cleavage/methylation domain-containing protein [Gemmatimonadota bacterium]NIR80411.1 prepilin-type N-terminal cleavage/methylation domain-containing protein [Gemmatimonadota bacterium]NIT89171.1 prepilin-type N-terminal cleavage/methylation domain-containing protein [Gemmatimonadota bacterium]NIU32971.1 prepilin-type N-terminal cleavage/methylation domain-containing protein [Gemmatimonadota bacterium]NIU37358.1 prepilin-type N-terminal cleavage/methylation domain-con
MRGCPEVPQERGEAGFSLLELIVAVLILGVGVVGAAGVMSVASADELRATVRSEMSDVAEQKLEQLRAYARGGIAGGDELEVGGSLSVSQADHADTARSALGRSFVRRWKLDNGPADTRTVTLRVEAVDPLPFRVPPLEHVTRILVQ